MSRVSYSASGGHNFWERLACFLRGGHKWNDSIKDRPRWMWDGADAICWHCGILLIHGEVAPERER